MEHIILRNDFHRTSAKVRVGQLSDSTARRVRRQLCGMKDCSCSGGLRMRGAQEDGVQVVEDCVEPGRYTYYVHVEAGQ